MDAVGLRRPGAAPAYRARQGGVDARRESCCGGHGHPHLFDRVASTPGARTARFAETLEAAHERPPGETIHELLWRCGIGRASVGGVLQAAWRARADAGGAEIARSLDAWCALRRGQALRRALAAGEAAAVHRDILDSEVPEDACPPDRPGWSRS
ncbi:hypothetical protein [Microbacterium sp.]|uniref:hypothetical protein n=1 Tax=Microbacterium sp. TaxID=51671 RepID=UPI003A959F19